MGMLTYVHLFFFKDYLRGYSIGNRYGDHHILAFREIHNSNSYRLHTSALVFYHLYRSYLSLFSVCHYYTFSSTNNSLSYYREKILQQTDKRVKIMSEIIKSMRVVKMYCWESVFENTVRLVRK